MGALVQSSPTMQGLLVLASFNVISALILPYGSLGYPYGYSKLGLGYGGLGLPHIHGASIVRPVAKDIEVAVTTINLEAAETGCTNSLGNTLPCHKEGEARNKREADEGAEAKAAPPGLRYAGLGFAGLRYPGVGYAGLGYTLYML